MSDEELVLCWAQLLCESRDNGQKVWVDKATVSLEMGGNPGVRHIFPGPNPGSWAVPAYSGLAGRRLELA
jgi:hypothetical protein